MKHRHGSLGLALVLTVAIAGACAAQTGEAQWIWATPNPSQVKECYFRQEFSLPEPEAGSIEITADGSYELYVNGDRIGEGSGWESMERYDLLPELVKGRNVLAIKAVNDGGHAGLSARVTVRNRGNTDVAHSTDATWKVSTKAASGWERARFDDRAWQAAASLGELGAAQPWGDKLRTADGKASGRFTLPPDFRVERVAPPSETGSLIAMTFNEYGEILASRERGPILLIRDANGDGALDSAEVFSDQVTDCQGLLALNGRVYAVGDGPNGIGLYLLHDTNGDRKADQLRLLFRFQKPRSEHGPHAPVLGPDGRIYLMVGNLNAAEVRLKATSPYRYFYEGDLALKRFDSAAGGGSPVNAPGGVILRTDPEGRNVEVFCGGFRNPYDMAFNRHGDLFTVDSDTEPDVGLPWYRPTRMCLCVPGAEFGWRSGWAAWPAYFFDSLPSVIDCGRGSPAGVEVYDHLRFPPRYQGAVFACDWSRGRILAYHVTRAGAHYRAEEETFIEGRPLNVTDIAVGPDGWLYFTTGGRGTEGGVYRVVAQRPALVPPVSPGILQAVRQPQLQSAWARNAIAGLKERIGAPWDQQLAALANDAKAEPEDRARALEVMLLVGPAPTPAMLVKLTSDAQAVVRERATMLLGVYGDAAGDARLMELLSDPEPMIRRKACEALVDRNAAIDVARVAPLLSDSDRYVRWAAGRVIERQPPQTWQAFVLEAKQPRAFLEGALAVLRTSRNASTSTLVLLRAADILKSELNDADLLDLLRLIEVALHRSGMRREQAPEIAALLNGKFPAKDPKLNRELIRLLTYLQEPTLAPRILAIIQSSAPLEERLLAGLYSVFVAGQWKPAERQALLEFFEQARFQPGGQNYEPYIETVTRDFVSVLPPAARLEVLDYADRAPSAATEVLRTLGPPDGPMTAKLIQIDARLAPRTRELAVMRLRTGVAALLSASKRPEALKYLREIFEREPDRRQVLAMGLAVEPNAENWPFLVRGMTVAEGEPARYIVEQLAKAPQKPNKPEDFRQAILCGLRLGDQGGKLVPPLLAHWTGAAASAADEPWNVALPKWQAWFRQQFPHELDPSLPVASDATSWTYDDLIVLLVGADVPTGDPQRGAAVFEKATCIKCHRYGALGESIGPDLTTVSQRFHKKEILESVLFPSQVISDQYAAKTVQTKDGLTYTGIVADQGGGTIVVLDNQAKKNVIAREDIAAIAPAKQSAMPDALFNTLTRDEIVDLFAYLSSPPDNP